MASRSALLGSKKIMTVVASAFVALIVVPVSLASGEAQTAVSNVTPLGRVALQAWLGLELWNA